MNEIYLSSCTEVDKKKKKEKSSFSKKLIGSI